MQGSCLCGAITYESGELIAPIVNCHCGTCRKAHGAAFSSVGRVARGEFRWTSGEEKLRHFESSPGKLRHFCGECGSHLMAERLNQAAVLLRLGCLDSDPGSHPAIHIWTSDGAPWFEIHDELPQYREGRTR
ncbi:MAG: GFA family protein [Gammaproteobacteria bacterium]|nr:GFA family protein [Gammaproteobacteria bacterium]